MSGFLKKALIVVAITVIVPAIAYFAVLSKAQTYTANVKILFDQPQLVRAPGGASSVSKIIQLIPTYEQIVTSYTIAEQAAKLSGVSAQEVQSSLTAKQMGEQFYKTQVLSVDAKNENPQKAVNIVTAAAQALNDHITKQQDRDQIKDEERMVLTVIEPATQAHANDSGKARTLLLTAIAAFILSIGGMLVFQDSRRA